MNARSSAILRDQFQVASMVSFVFFRISTLFFVLSLSTYLDPSIYANKMQTNYFYCSFSYLSLLSRYPSSFQDSPLLVVLYATSQAILLPLSRAYP